MAGPAIEVGRKEGRRTPRPRRRGALTVVPRPGRRPRERQAGAPKASAASHRRPKAPQKSPRSRLAEGHGGLAWGVRRSRGRKEGKRDAPRGLRCGLLFFFLDPLFWLGLRGKRRIEAPLEPRSPPPKAGSAGLFYGPKRAQEVGGGDLAEGYGLWSGRTAHAQRWEPR